MVESHLTPPYGDGDALLEWAARHLRALLAGDGFWLGYEPLNQANNDQQQAGVAIAPTAPPAWYAEAQALGRVWRAPMTDGGILVLAVAESLPPLALLEPFLALLAEHLSSRELCQQSCCQALHQYQGMLDGINSSIIGMDLDGYITSWNRGAEQMFGYTKDEAIGRHLLFLYADSDEDESLLSEACASGSAKEMLIQRKHRDGSVFWASIHLSLLQNEAGEPEGLLGYLVDATERMRAEEKLRLQSAIMEYSKEAIMVTNVQGRIVSINRAFSRLFGLSAERLIGHEHAFLYCRRYGADFWRNLRREAERDDHWMGEIRCAHTAHDSIPCWLSFSAVRNLEGQLTHFVAMLMDISEHQQAKEKIYQLAYFDTLTGLPNRAMLRVLLTQALEEAKRLGTYGALMLLNIDRFKRINDALGVSVGDELLVQLAARIRQALRAEDVVARCGPDEFVIALFDIAERDHAGIVAQKLLRAVREPVTLTSTRQETLNITASIGVAVFPNDGTDSDSLLRQASIAMDRLRQAPDPEPGYLFFAADMNERARERHQLEEDLRGALRRDELVLYFQPQYAIPTRHMQAAEVLLRWEHPEKGMIGPHRFIPIAEETGLIHDIGDWVLERACALLREWIDLGIEPVRLAVNLSARQLRPRLAERILSLLECYQVSPDLLELEITESLLVQDDERALRLLETLRAAGLAIALDDFGTGYSALGYLRRLPIDKLKIDRSFVADLPGSEQETALVLSIIRLAQTHGLTLVAEGVETQAQLDFLQAHGCPAVQGFLLARPMPRESLEALLGHAA